jgi:PmbA protein
VKKRNATTSKNNQSFDKVRLCELANDVLAQAKMMGASAAEVDLDVGSGFAVSVRNAKLENIEHHDGKNLGVTVYFGTRTGVAYTSDFRPDAIKLMLEKACYIARFTAEDPYAGLADPELLAYDYPDLKLYYPWEIETQEAIAIAESCENYSFAEDTRITNSEGTSFTTAQVFSLYGNSHGFIGSVVATKHKLSSVLIAKCDECMQRDGYYTAARDPQDLENAQQVAHETCKRVLRRLNPRRIAITCECPVIFEAEVAKELFGELIAAISGGNLYRKASFLLDHLGKPVIAKQVTLDERPHLPKLLNSAPFDGDGVKNLGSNIVIDGVLQRYVLGSYAARKLKLQTTGNAGGVHNLFVSTSQHDLSSLLRLMHKGLLVVELMGDGVNLVTGDYSRGAFGFWVENGEIQYPVEGITIAGNLQTMFMDIVAIGNDVDHKGGIFTGSVLLEKMTVAG